MEFFGEGKLHIHEPAVTEYHDEEGKPAAGRPHGDGTGAAPIDLGTFGGSKMEGRKSCRSGCLGLRTHLANKVGEDGIAAPVARFTHTLENLPGAQVVLVHPAHNLPLIGIQFALARCAAAALIAFLADPFGHRLL